MDVGAQDGLVDERIGQGLPDDGPAEGGGCGVDPCHAAIGAVVQGVEDGGGTGLDRGHLADECAARRHEPAAVVPAEGGTHIARVLDKGDLSFAARSDVADLRAGATGIGDGAQHARRGGGEAAPRGATVVTEFHRPAGLVGQAGEPTRGVPGHRRGRKILHDDGDGAAIDEARHHALGVSELPLPILDPGEHIGEARGAVANLLIDPEGVAHEGERAAIPADESHDTGQLACGDDGSGAGRAQVPVERCRGDRSRCRGDAHRAPPHDGAVGAHADAHVPGLRRYGRPDVDVMTSKGDTRAGDRLPRPRGHLRLHDEAIGQPCLARGVGEVDGHARARRRALRDIGGGHVDGFDIAANLFQLRPRRSRLGGEAPSLGQAGARG